MHNFIGYNENSPKISASLCNILGKKQILIMMLLLLQQEQIQNISNFKTNLLEVLVQVKLPKMLK